MDLDRTLHMVGRIATGALWGILLGYLVYCCFAFVRQRQVLFPRSIIEIPPQVSQDVLGVEKLWLNTSHGRVEAWFLPSGLERSTGPAPAVIFAHGNAELIDFWPGILKGFTRLGIGVLLVEYPGYGRSEGCPSQRSITEAFVAAYDVLVAREDVDASRIILFGRSLGGGAVCALAAERPSTALILLSSFTSVESFASDFHFPRFLIRDPFDSLAVVSSYSGPVLVMHGSNDDVIPYEHGVALCRAAQHGEMIAYDCRHNDCPPSWGQFWRDVESFLHSAGIIENHVEAAYD